MSVIPLIAPFKLPRILPRLRRDYPDWKLFVRKEPSRPAYEDLHNGRADCVLLALPFACGEVASQALFDDRLFIDSQPDEMGNVANAMLASRGRSMRPIRRARSRLSGAADPHAKRTFSCWRPRSPKLCDETISPLNRI